MTARLTQAELLYEADAITNVFSSDALASRLSAVYRQAASDAATLDALWREIAGKDPWIAYGEYHNDYMGCYWCTAIEPGDEFPHSADCTYVRACKAVEGAK